MTIAQISKKTGINKDVILETYITYHDFTKVKIRYSLEEFYKDMSLRFSTKCEELADNLEYLKKENELLKVTIKQQDETIKRLKEQL